MWADPADSQGNIAWVRRFWDDMRPSSVGAAYVNYMTEDDGPRVASAYGGNYERLVSLKSTYDPGNLFRQNQNIVPLRRAA